MASLHRIEVVVRQNVNADATLCVVIFDYFYAYFVARLIIGATDFRVILFMILVMQYLDRAHRFLLRQARREGIA